MWMKMLEPAEPVEIARPGELDELAEICLDAIAVLRERGWYQGGYENLLSGEVCILGAICIARYGGTSVHGRELRPLIELNMKLNRRASRAGLAPDGIGIWNDTVCRDIMEAEQFLRKLAAAPAG